MKLYLYLALLLAPALAHGIGIIAEAGNDSCPYPYTKVLDECFFPSDLKLTWNAARHYCRGMNGDLATPSALYALHGYLRSINFNQNAFLGATNAQKNMEWLWLDGKPIKTYYWFKNQPDNYLGKEHCLELYIDRNPPLNDTHCTNLLAFVCQIKPQ